MSRTSHALRLVRADEDEGQKQAGSDRRLDLAVESGAIFGLHGPRGRVWASVDGPDRDAEPPETPEAA
jgi:hypothetical protein